MKGDEQIKYGGKLLVFGCPRSKSCTSVLSLDHACFVSILRQWSHCWKSYTREFVEVIQVAGGYHIEPLLRSIGG